MTDFDGMVATIPEHHRGDARELAEDILFMRRKLAETRRSLATASVVIPYDNGGGQTGIRKNPEFDAYESLLKSYEAAIRELRSLLAPAEGDAESPGRLTELRRGSPLFKAV